MAERRATRDVDHDAEEQGAPLLSESLQKEREKLKVKEWSRRLQAAEAKQLLPSERYRGIDDEVHAAKARRDELDAQHEKAHANNMLMTAKRSPVDLHDKRVYLASDLPEQACTQMRHIITTHSMEITCRMDAHYLVERSIANPGKRSTWAAVLLGACIVDTSFMAQHGAGGTCTKYVRAVGVKRHVWISTQCEQQNPTIVGMIKEAAGRAVSKWKLLENEAQFLRMELNGRRPVAVVAMEEITGATHLDDALQQTQVFYPFPRDDDGSTCGTYSCVI